MKQINLNALIFVIIILCMMGNIDCVRKIYRSAYEKNRNSIIESENKMVIGANIQLTAKEKQVDAVLKQLKQNEISAGVNHPETYAPGLHYFTAKKIIDASSVFSIIKQMPKGALLHGHDKAMVSSKWIVEHITYHPKIMKCSRENGKIAFTFRYIKDERYQCSNYVRIAEDRSASKDNKTYDMELEKLINLYESATEGLDDSTESINTIWAKFNGIFGTIHDIVHYKDTFRPYLKQLLLENYADKIMYIELRTSFGEIYDDNGVSTSAVETATIMRDTINDFKRQHPDFLGAKAIFAVSRNLDKSQLNETMNLYKELKIKLPDFVIGFDLVGQEDLGTELKQYTNALKSLPKNTNFFFHAGETNSYGYGSDRNLVDAILLNATRIGHGYSLHKHPVLLNMVRQRNICIEICPISNQVLKLVKDLRNHPASNYISQNLRVVVSNDDPAFWGVSGLSYDLYYVFMSMAPATATLGFLKQLVLNSIKCSILNSSELRMAQALFEKQWNDFLNKVLSTTDKNATENI